MRTKRPLAINNSLAHGICNYSCRLCAVNKPGYCGPREYQSREVTEQLIARVEYAASAGVHVRYIANAGDGEPTLHPEFGARMELFGGMLRAWSAPVPAPEISVVSNGERLLAPGILDAIAGNALMLHVSFPTSEPEAYGEMMTGSADRGTALLEKVLAGITAAMRLAAAGKLLRLVFHVSPPEREIVRRGFAGTVELLTSLAAEAGLEEVKLVMFPATSNRSGLIRSRFAKTDMYRDLFRRYDRRRFNGVAVSMELVLKRFFRNVGEIVDLVRAYRFPCLWNANLFVAADGSSICCNDQAVRNPMGNVLTHSLDELVREREDYLPGRTCAGCDQRPEKLKGSLSARIFSLAARARLRLARAAGAVKEPRPARVPAKARTAASAAAGSGSYPSARNRVSRGGPARLVSGRRRSRLTAALRALETELRTGSETPAVDYRFGPDGEYSLHVAATAEDRRRAWGLVYRVYVEKEYAATNDQELWYGLHDAHPDTTTLLVEREGKAAATLTTVFDSPLALPADSLFAAEVQALRDAGRRLCEIVSLVCAEKSVRRGMELVKHMFKLSYLTASRLEAATDLLITVNPRHVGFYERVLLMEQVGTERRYEKVGGAPAVLLRLDLRAAEERYRERYGDSPESLFRFFVNEETEGAIVAMISAERRGIGEEALRRYFVEERPLLARASPRSRAFLQDCYLPYDLEPASLR